MSLFPRPSTILPWDILGLIIKANWIQPVDVTVETSLHLFCPDEDRFSMPRHEGEQEGYLTLDDGKDRSFQVLSPHRRADLTSPSKVSHEANVRSSSSSSSPSSDDSLADANLFCCFRSLCRELPRGSSIAASYSKPTIPSPRSSTWFRTPPPSSPSPPSSATSL